MLFVETDSTGLNDDKLKETTMANQSHRGGTKKSAAQTGSEQQHQGVHPGSTTQSQQKHEKKTGSRNTPGADPHANEQIVPKKDHYESNQA